MILNGTTRDSQSDFVVGHEFHDHLNPSIASSSKKSITRSSISLIGDFQIRFHGSESVVEDSQIKFDLVSRGSENRSRGYRRSL